MSKEKTTKGKDKANIHKSNRSDKNNSKTSSWKVFGILLLVLIITIIIGFVVYKLGVSSSFNSAVDKVYNYKSIYQKYNDRFYQNDPSDLDFEQEIDENNGNQAQSEGLDSSSSDTPDKTDTTSDLIEDNDVSPTNLQSNEELSKPELANNLLPAKTPSPDESTDLEINQQINNNQSIDSQEENLLIENQSINNSSEIDTNLTELNTKISDLELNIKNLAQTIADNNAQIDKLASSQQQTQSEGQAKFMEQLNVFKRMVELEYLASNGQSINNQLDYLAKYIDIDQDIYATFEEEQPSNLELSQNLEKILPRALAYEKTRNYSQNNNNFLYPLYTITYSIFTISNKTKTLATIPLSSFQAAIEDINSIQSLGQRLLSVDIKDSHPLSEWIAYFKQRQIRQQSIDILWQNLTQVMSTDY